MEISRNSLKLRIFKRVTRNVFRLFPRLNKNIQVARRRKIKKNNQSMLKQQLRL